MMTIINRPNPQKHSFLSFSSSLSFVRPLIAGLFFWGLSTPSSATSDATLLMKQQSVLSHDHRGLSQSDTLSRDTDPLPFPRLHPHLDSLVAMSNAHITSIAHRIFAMDARFLKEGMYPGDLKRHGLYTIDRRRFDQRTDTEILVLCQKFPQFFFETTFEERRYLYQHPQFFSYLQTESLIFDSFVIPLGLMHWRRLYGILRMLDTPGVSLMSKDEIEKRVYPYRYDIKGIMTDAMYATILQALTRHAGLLHQSYEAYILPEQFINDVLPIVHPLLLAHCVYDRPDDLHTVLPNFSHTKAFGLLVDYDIVQQPSIKKTVITGIQKLFGELCLYRQQKKYPPTAFVGLFLQIMTTGDFRWGVLPTGDGLAGYPFLPVEKMGGDPAVTLLSSPYRYRHISGSSLLSVFHDFEHELRSGGQPHEWVVPFLVTMIAYESGHQDIKSFFTASINYNVIDLPAHSLGITQVLFTYIPHISHGQSIQHFLTNPDLQVTAYLSLLREYMNRSAVKKFVKTQTIYPQFPTMKSADERLMLALFHLCALGNFESNEALVDAIAKHPYHRDRFKHMMRLLTSGFTRQAKH